MSISQQSVSNLSRTPLPVASKFRKEDFEMGFILQSKSDRELIYIARKKFSPQDQNVRNATESHRSNSSI